MKPFTITTTTLANEPRDLRATRPEVDVLLSMDGHVVPLFPREQLELADWLIAAATVHVDDDEY